MNNVFYKPQEEKIQRSQIWITRQGIGPPLSVQQSGNSLSRKALNMTGEVRWCTI
jgi:hypothetical protein